MTTGQRRASRSRVTKETSVQVELGLDGEGRATVDTGLPFFDHLLDQLGRHGGLDLTVKAVGDLEVDAHHTVEDVGIVLGSTLAEALGDKAGVRRFASALLPLDEALIQVALDLSGRPYLAYSVELAPVLVGSFDPQLAEEFWRAFVISAGVALHVHSLSGKNAHHVLEASFKGVARALGDAVRRDGSSQLPTTKDAW
ncbi:MAG: imidazoleglycerol-phosphate dehydratase HisB [Acidimicrobiia bacterium]